MPERLLTALLLCLLTGCTDETPADLWEDYLVRLERLSGTEATEPAALRPPPWPRYRKLHQPLPDPRTGLMRYLDLKRCGLRELVSRRNSILGKVEAPSLRLAYELRFLDRAESCLDNKQLEYDPEMRDWLTDLVATKRRALPALMWNVSLAGRELAGFLSYSRGAPMKAPPESTAGVRALAELTRLARAVNQSPLPKDTGELERALQTLDHSEAGGRLVMGMALAHRELIRAARVLEAVDAQALCPKGRTSARGRRFHNVFTAIYAGRVQPWLSAIWRASEPLGKALMSLRDVQPIESKAVDLWLSRVFSATGLSGQLEEASRRHARAWHDLLEPCGLAPRRP